MCELTHAIGSDIVTVTITEPAVGTSGAPAVGLPAPWEAVLVHLGPGSRWTVLLGVGVIAVAITVGGRSSAAIAIARRALSPLSLAAQP